jgi:hypothetical protein
MVKVEKPKEEENEEDCVVVEEWDRDKNPVIETLEEGKDQEQLDHQASSHPQYRNPIPPTLPPRPPPGSTYLLLVVCPQSAR